MKMKKETYKILKKDKDKKQLRAEDRSAFKWFLIGVVCIMILLIVINLQQATKDNPYSEACKTLCEEDKALDYANYGYKSPCASSIWQECIICFCFTDGISKQMVAYDYETSEAYTDLFRSI